MAGVHIKRRLSSCACLPLLPSRRPTLTPSVLPISTACVKTACDIIAVSSGRDLRIPPPTSLTPAVHLRTTHLAPTCSSSPVWTKKYIASSTSFPGWDPRLLLPFYLGSVLSTLSKFLSMSRDSSSCTMVLVLDSEASLSSNWAETTSDTSFVHQYWISPRLNHRFHSASLQPDKLSDRFNTHSTKGGLQIFVPRNTTNALMPNVWSPSETTKNW